MLTVIWEIIKNKKVTEYESWRKFYTVVIIMLEFENIGVWLVWRCLIYAYIYEYD